MATAVTAPDEVGDVEFVDAGRIRRPSHRWVDQSHDLLEVACVPDQIDALLQRRTAAMVLLEHDIAVALAQGVLRSLPALLCHQVERFLVDYVGHTDLFDRHQAAAAQSSLPHFVCGVRVIRRDTADEFECADVHVEAGRHVDLGPARCDGTEDHVALVEPVPALTLKLWRDDLYAGMLRHALRPERVVIDELPPGSRLVAPRIRTGMELHVPPALSGDLLRHLFLSLVAFAAVVFLMTLIFSAPSTGGNEELQLNAVLTVWERHSI
mmetsp:Transcript_42674/g.106345  ORF Transcript_42674/g.106345 Transcript_42674/m.106345 type:complete len:267 (+) Transcript_42674:1068-1868(+)